MGERISLSVEDQEAAVVPLVGRIPGNPTLRKIVLIVPNQGPKGPGFSLFSHSSNRED